MATFGILQSVLLCCVTWLTWRFLRRFIVRSPLDNISGPPPASFWQGNMKQYADFHAQEFQRHVAQDYESVVRLHGFMGETMLSVHDTKALHTILIKDEHIFEESDSFIRANLHMYGPGLSSTIGDHHRKQRKMLNPVFSVKHMRHMLPIFNKTVHRLRDAITTQVQAGSREIDMLSWMGRVALELIGQSGLGYSFDPLVEDKKDDYGEAIKSLFPTYQQLILFRGLLRYTDWLLTKRLQRRVLEVFPSKIVRRMKDIVDKMSERSRAIFEEKKSALQRGDDAVVHQVGEGKDIMSILLKANLEASESDKLPEEELVAQMSTLIVAAMDTSSNSLARILQLLAQNPDVQEIVRKEVIEAMSGEDLSFDQLMQLPNLDAVVRETLRLFPPVMLLTRNATKDTVLPLSKPIRARDGTMMKEIPVPKNTTIILGILGANTSTDRWGEDALEWKPARWLSALPSKVTEGPAPGVFSHLLTFLGGRRACIGFKFSELEIKVVLSVLLSTFKFEETNKPIFWNIGPITFPTVGKDNIEPKMPLKVELLQRDYL